MITFAPSDALITDAARLVGGFRPFILGLPSARDCHPLDVYTFEFEAARAFFLAHREELAALCLADWGCFMHELPDVSDDAARECLAGFPNAGPDDDMAHEDTLNHVCFAATVCALCHLSFYLTQE